MYDTFVELVKRGIEKELGADYGVRVELVMKNNHSPMEIMSIIKRGENASPAIDLEEYYHEYLSGKDLQHIIHRILGTYFEYKLTTRIDMRFMLDFENIRDQVQLRLVSCEKNRCLLEHIPHRHFMDLVLIYYFRLDHEQLGRGYVRIQNEHLLTWGITEEELFQTAVCNTLMNMQYKFMGIPDMLEALTGKPMEEEGLELPVSVLTNQECAFGAVCMIFPHILDAVAGKVGGDFYLLPSSVHECMVLPINEEMTIPVCILQMLVEEMNRDHVPEEDVLSDSIYRYCAGARELRIVSGMNLCLEA